jgi:hypothetical protein
MSDNAEDQLAVVKALNALAQDGKIHPRDIVMGPKEPDGLIYADGWGLAED